MLLLKKIKNNLSYFDVTICGDNFSAYLTVLKMLPSSKWLKKQKVWRISIYDYDLLLKDCKNKNLYTIEIDSNLKPVIEMYQQYQKQFIELAKQNETDFEIDHSFLKGKLAPYQKVMVEYFLKRKKGINGSGMGIGKTFPSLVSAWLLHLENKIKNCLIVCPASIKYNWAKEIDKFFIKPSYTIIEGKQEERSEMYYDENTFFKIVNYEILRKDWKEVLGDIVYDCVLVDEIHRIRNHKTQQAQAIYSAGENAKYKFGITGTPIHNKLHDLFSLMKFIHPDLLGSWWRFSERYIKKGYFGEIVGYKNLPEIHDKLKFIMIRKTKDEVMKDLPPKTRQDIYVDLTPYQRKLYHKKTQEIILDEDGNFQEGSHLMKLIYLRQICNTTEILGETEIESSKITELKIIVNDLMENGEKIVIFSQWVRMLKILQRELKKYKPFILTGEISTSGGVRQELIDEFTESKTRNLFLMSTAGGEGINLQCANYMIFLDLPFNPQVINQIEDRIHRRGQTKNVTIIRFIAKNTIEEQVLEILKDKIDLATQVVEGQYEYKLTITKEMLKKALDEW